MGQVPLTRRQGIGKVLEVWALVLAVLFGLPAVSSGQRPPTPAVTYCGCTCWYSGPGGKTQSKGTTFTTDRSCTIYNHQTCYCDDQTCYLEYKTGSRYKGALYDCKTTLPPKLLEPPAGQRRVTPPGGTLQKSP